MKNIKELRKASGYSQTELAELLGVGQSTVGMWEIDANSPRIEMIPKLAAVLNCDISDLFSETQEQD